MVLQGAYGPLYHQSVWVPQRHVLLVGIELWHEMLQGEQRYIYVGCEKDVVVLPVRRLLGLCLLL